MNPFKSARCSCGCCLFLVLLFLFLVGGVIFLAVYTAKAAGPEGDSLSVYDVVLVSDQSASMLNCDGIGTDPELLRVDATRLFINTLGADSSAKYRLALLHFGGEVEQIAPLTDLADATARQALIEAASRPQLMRWTDHLLALQTASKLLAEMGEPNSRRLIILLTDGEPAPVPSTGYDDVRYLEALRAEATALAQQETTLAIVVLTDMRTSCGRHAAADWLVHWAKLAETTPGGALYTASQAEDLLPVYHAIVRGMIGATQGAPQPMSATLVVGEPITMAVPVTETLTSVILTIWKANPATTVQVVDPTGSVISTDRPGVTIAGRGTTSREEVWRVTLPQPGVWQVVLSGQGRVSVWQDRVHLPTPTLDTIASTYPKRVAATATAPARNITTAPPPLVERETIASASAEEASVMRPTPAATPSEDTPSGSITLHSPLWPLLGGGILVIGGLVGFLAFRAQGPFLIGQLIPIVVPADSTLMMPRDLGSERRRRVHLGQQGEREWRLAGWSGAVCLTAVGRRSVAITPVAGEVTLNGQLLHGSAALEDGAVIGCGAYLIRYENLLN